MAFPALPAPLNLSITDPNDSPSKANPNAIFKKNQSVKTYKRQETSTCFTFSNLLFKLFGNFLLYFLFLVLISLTYYRAHGGTEFFC